MRVFSAAAALAGLVLAGCIDRSTPDPRLSSRDTEYLAQAPTTDADAATARRRIDDPTGEKPGTIIVDTKENVLYFVLPNRQAVRYAVSSGREAYGWTGTAYIKAKREWPDWTPPSDMVARMPNLQPLVDMGGLPGGPENPLGARAMYLFDPKGHDTMYRIHGTNEPDKIGRSVSSGCIRLTNIDAIDLFDRAQVGTKVIVR